MGKKSSPPPPPPPPDYTLQRNAEKLAVSQQYGREADAYNSQVKDYNTGLQNYLNQYNNLADSSSNWDVNSIGDVNKNDLTSLRNQLQNYSFDATRPNFSPTISSYGQTVYVGAPTLNTANTNQQKNTLSGVNDLLSQYNSIMSQRNQALSADNQFRDNMNSDIADFWSQANNANIYDTGTLAQIRSGYNQLDSRLDNYSSQLNDANFGGLSSSLSGIQNWISNQQNAYDTEAQRIEDYRSSLDDSIYNFGNQAGNLTIADIDQIDSLDNQINNLMSGVRGFDTKINTDFSGYLNGLRGLDDQVDSLRDQRRAEEKRIADNTRSFDRQLSTMMRNLPNQSLYSGSGFDLARSNIEDLMYNMQNYDSLLNPDFSAQLSQAQLAQDALDARYAERRGNIDQITGRAMDARQGALDTDLWDEQGMRDALADINNESRNLGMYTGGRTAEDRAMLDNAIAAIEGRLGELNDYRGGIENRAQGLLDQVNDQQFYGLADVDAMQAKFDEMAAERDLYGASQANNELADVLSILTGNRSRIETDIAEREARAARESESAANNLFGMDRNYILQQLEGSDLSPEEFSALIARTKEQDPEFANQLIQQYGSIFGIS